MSPEVIASLVGTMIVGLIGIFNLLTSNKRNSSLNTLDSSNNLKILNEAIQLANNRALAAEEKLDKAEKYANDKIFLLEQRVRVLESSLSYRLTFDVMLGTSPSVNGVRIEHFVERRKVEIPVKHDRRKRDLSN
jgi:hypothetical protein